MVKIDESLRSNLTEIQFFRIRASSTMLPLDEQKIKSPFFSFHLTGTYQLGADVVKGSKHLSTQFPSLISVIYRQALKGGISME